MCFLHLLLCFHVTILKINSLNIKFTFTYNPMHEVFFSVNIVDSSMLCERLRLRTQCDM